MGMKTLRSTKSMSQTQTLHIFIKLMDPEQRESRWHKSKIIHLIDELHDVTYMNDMKVKAKLTRKMKGTKREMGETKVREVYRGECTEKTLYTDRKGPL